MKHFFLVFLLVLEAKATMFYVATNGLTSNSGLTAGTPWTQDYWLAQASQSNSVTFLPGTNYHRMDLLSQAQYNGTYFLSSSKWGAVVKGNNGGAGDVHTWVIGNGVSGVTIDGFDVGFGSNDCIQLAVGTTNCTIRNCYVHDAAHGQVNWTVNSVGTSVSGFYGTNAWGIAIDLSGGVRNILIEKNFVRNNGAFIGFDQAIYLFGTNITIRGNVIVDNIAAAVQGYHASDNGYTANLYVYENLMYNNCANGGFSDAMNIWTAGNCTNYVFSNTIGVTNRYAINSEYGTLVLTNNILMGTGSSTSVLDGSDHASVIDCDYNLVLGSLSASGSTVNFGGHNTTGIASVSSFGFVNPANGLYWLGSGSIARNAALQTAFGPVDFFGSPQSLVLDVGAFQYNGLLAGDTRVLDPAPSGADYWTLPSRAQTSPWTSTR